MRTREMTETESNTAVDDCDVFDPEIDETIPPFRPGPEPSGLTAGAWLQRWGVGLAGWGVFVLVIYLTAGAHLNAYLSLAGLLVGFLVGLTGMGGGALMTPILILFFGFEPTTAIGTDITYAAVTKIVGSWRHRRLGSVDMPLAFWLAAGSVPAALLGVAAVTYVRTTTATSSMASSIAPSAARSWRWRSCWWSRSSWMSTAPATRTSA